MKTLHKNLLAPCIIFVVLALGSSAAFSQVSLSIDVAPPPLQVYTQPPCPDDGYLWTPGYWAYDDNAYYWVPGAWVQPPQIGELWTPPYWGWNGNAYVFYPGYWGPNVGYYGGINYGYGYGGNGYGGGRWRGGHFSYNTAVNNVSSAHVHYTYADKTAVKNSSSRVSYNGGKGGVQARPTSNQRQVSSTRRTQPVSVQPNASKTPQVTSTRGSTGASSKRQSHAAQQPPPASQNTHATESQVTAVKPQNKSNATHQSPPVSQATPQSHPATHAQPQAHTQPQTHAQPPAHAQPQEHAPSQEHTQPQGPAPASGATR